MGTSVTLPQITVTRRVTTVAELRGYLEELEANGAPADVRVRMGNMQISAEWQVEAQLPVWRPAS